MGVPPQQQSLAQFLAWENDQADRHEFWRGEVFAMVGAKRGHGRIVANLIRHLGNQLDDTPCQAFSENMKVQAGDDAIFYPDVMVTCDREFSADQLVFDSPLLIIEVLSPSTEAFDRGRKWAAYRRIDSLREYVLIDPDTRSVELYRRDAAGAWDFLDMSALDNLELAAVGCEIALAAVFKGVDGPALGPLPAPVHQL